MKEKPISVGAFAIVVCTARPILALSIEILATAPYVIEYAVQHYFYTEVVRLTTQFLEVGLRAEHWIDGFVIFGVVLVVTVRLEYRIEINRLDV